jgi:cytochrome c biogenesis protein
MSDAPPPQDRPAAVQRWLHDGIELLSSMRFAIALLTVICIASVIGTVVQQNQPAVNYVNEFGPFWSEVFRRLGLYAVYSTGWFLVILGFLVASTSLCIARNAPKILHDLRSFKEGVRDSALMAFHHKGRGERPEAPAAVLDQVAALLGPRGWQARVQDRPTGTMVAARKGTSNRLGYLAAHGAIVLICIGGLIDGDLIVRLQMLLQDKAPYVGDGQVADVPARHRLGEGNPTYRGNLFVAEGGKEHVALITLPDGVVLQELPFDIELKKFTVEYYDTGMPKLFASDVVLHDRDGKTTTARIKVNEPLVHNGVTIFQSGFEDGGSRVRLKGHPLDRTGAPLDVEGNIGSSVPLVSQSQGEKLQLEFTELRPTNVENMAEGESTPEGSTDARGVNFGDSLGKHLGSGARNPEDRKTQQNIGPSISYKLRDAAGQAREFHNFMVPVTLGGQRVFLLGVRNSPDEPFRYLRPPADAQDTLDDWLRMRSSLNDRKLRETAALRHARLVTPKNQPDQIEPMRQATLKALELFSGADPQAAASTDPGTRNGMPAMEAFLRARVPAKDQARAAEVMMQVLGGGMQALLDGERTRQGLPPLPATEASQKFMVQAVLTLSDSYAYPAPLLFTLEGFDQIQASTFQVTRTPGKLLVYLGCILLALGVCAMLYVRERRLWIWIEPTEAGGSQLTMAMSVTRQSLDNDREFDALRQTLLAPSAATPSPESDPA